LKTKRTRTPKEDYLLPFHKSSEADILPQAFIHGKSRMRKILVLGPESHVAAKNTFPHPFSCLSLNFRRNCI
jgi:hypothetical protein